VTAELQLSDTSLSAMIALLLFLRMNLTLDHVGLARRVPLFPIGKVYPEQIGPNRRRRVGALLKGRRRYGASYLRASLLQLGIRR
jgi:hypothetical protein